MEGTRPEPATGSELVRLPAAEAHALARDALLGAGAAAAVAECVAEHVVEAELSGPRADGLWQVQGYCDYAGQPGYLLDVLPAIVRQTPALTLVDGRGGIGHPALALATDAAAAAARETGIAAAAVIACGHTGRAGAWVERGAARGCVTVVALAGVDEPFAMTAAPGAVPSLGTNPLAVAAPASGAPLLLDIAASIVAQGKVAVALARGTALPEGAIATRDGRRSTNRPSSSPAGRCSRSAGTRAPAWRRSPKRWR